MIERLAPVPIVSPSTDRVKSIVLPPNTSRIWLRVSAALGREQAAVRFDNQPVRVFPVRIRAKVLGAARYQQDTHADDGDAQPAQQGHALPQYQAGNNRDEHEVQS